MCYIKSMFNPKTPTQIILEAESMGKVRSRKQTALNLEASVSHLNTGGGERQSGGGQREGGRKRERKGEEERGLRRERGREKREDGKK